MNLELLRELATVDPELLEHDTGFFHETFTIKGAHGRKFGFFGPSENIKDEDWDPVIKVRYDIEQAEAEKIFFFALLERIQARGWKWDRVHYTDEQADRTDTLVRVHKPQNVIYWCLDTGSLVEALAHAYIQACKEITC